MKIIFLFYVLIFFNHSRNKNIVILYIVYVLIIKLHFYLKI